MKFFPLISFLVSLSLVPLAIKMAKKFKIMDIPGGLKSHENPIPYLGGLPIVIGFLINPILYKEGILFPLSVFLIFLLGFFDDIKPLSPYSKLIVETIFATLLVFSGIRTRIIFFSFTANVIISIIWIVGITNSFNIIDVMDGIAGGVGFIAATTLAFITLTGGDINEALVAAALAGSIAGFIPFNLPKAKIFLGDAGSLTIGFTLSVIALRTSYSFANPVAIVVPLFILFFPIYDTFYVFIQRIIKGKNPLKGSPDHFVLKLRGKNLPVIVIDAIIYLISISLCEASYIITKVGFKGALIILFIIIGIFVIVGTILRGAT